MSRLCATSSEPERRRVQRPAFGLPQVATGRRVTIQDSQHDRGYDVPDTNRANPEDGTGAICS
jgi:hypothetical protein